MSPAEVSPSPDRQTVALVIEPSWIIPIEPASTVLTDHAIVIDDGRIVDLLPIAAVELRYNPIQTEKLPGQVVLPGLVNLHCHAAMTLLRGYADDLPLMQWLEAKIWPAEATFVGPDFVRAGSGLACMEMLHGGITCFNDMYFFPEETAEATLSCGIRASLGMVVIDFPTAYATDLSDYIARGRDLCNRYQHHESLTFCWAPHAPYTVCDEAFERVVDLSNDMDVPIHVHVHETRQEILDETVRHGVRPLARLNRLGALGPKTIGVHAVHLDQQDLKLIKATGTHLAHCPTSNLKLGSGIAAVPDWLTHEINFGLGTDGAASNNRLDMWREMRQANLLAKGISGNATTLTSHQTLRTATLGGAKALGLGHKIGSIVPGKCADLIAVELGDWIQQPLYDPASHLIHVADRTNVSTVWVNGQCVVKKHTLLSDGLGDQMNQVKEWQNRIRNR